MIDVSVYKMRSCVVSSHPSFPAFVCLLYSIRHYRIIMLIIRVWGNVLQDVHA